MQEETGLTLTKYKLRSVVTFLSDKWETEYMYLFTASEFEGEVKECDEGELVWVDKDEVLGLPTWEGDHIFLELIAKDTPYFSLKVRYEGEKLVESKLIEYND